MARLRDAYIELKDIGDTLSRIASGIESDPVRLANADSRLKQLYDAVKRFKVEDFDHLVDLYQSLKEDAAGSADGAVSSVLSRRRLRGSERCSNVRPRK